MDGLPLYKSCSKEVWPILLRVLNAKDTRPFAVCLYVGEGKPKSIEEFSRQFIEEMRDLMDNGVTIGGVKYLVTVANFNNDAPARQFAKNIVGHCNKHGCERCNQTGVRINGNANYMTMQYNARI